MRVALLGLLSIFAACSSKSTPPPAQLDAQTVAIDAGTKEKPDGYKLTLTEASFADLAGWREDNHLEAVGALRRSCATLVRKKDDAQVGLYPIAGTVADWRELCKAAPGIKDRDSARSFFEEHFVVRRVANHDDQIGRFTGYYNARIVASRKKGGKFKHPVWGRPSDLISARLSDFNSKLRGERIWGKLKGTRVVPYDTRRQIYKGSIKKRAKVLFWATDPIDIFFAQVQGSAIIELPRGEMARIGVAGKNGRIYTAIGRVLIADGALTRETVSMQSIRAWMIANPDKATALMEENEAFVFFREIKGDGPRGAQGVVLTPGRSLAVDLRWIPMSVPLWVDTEVPAVDSEKTVPYRRLMIAQDTGGAIRGPVRGDIYFGDDAAAFSQAGRMKGTGGYHVLVPKGVALELP